MTHLLAALFSCALIGATLAQSPLLPPDGGYWLRQNSLDPWEWDVDRDGDGMSNRQEYYAGTDPRDIGSRLDMEIALEGGEIVVSWEGLAGARYDFLGSGDLEAWTSLVEEPLLGAGLPLEVGMVPTAARQFFSLEPLAPGDADDDGLSDREEAILGTNPDLKNTDGDRFDDGTEVFSTFTDPTVFDPDGGTISGRVFLDDDLSGDLTDAVPVAGTTVFLDLDYDGELSETDPRMTTDSDGRYAFFNLPPNLYEVRQLLVPGETQTLPAEVTPQLPDGFADEVVSYTHAEGSALDEAYGYIPLPFWPGQIGIILANRITPVDPSVLLEPFGQRLDFPPIGSFAPAHYLSLPAGASVELRFDEVIYDGEGTDFTVGIPTQGFGGAGFEPADLYFGPEAETAVKVELESLTKMTFTEFDLADYPEVPFVQYVRLESRTPGGAGEGGTDRGFGFGGIRAASVLPLTSSARRVRITATEEFLDENFGKFFQDLPPTLLLSTNGETVRATQPYRLRLVASDDLGIASETLRVNGQELTPDAEGGVEYTPAFPGELVVSGTVTDSGGQETSQTWTLFVADENGALPFDPGALALEQGVGRTRVQIFSPEPGDVPGGDTTVVGSIVGDAGEIPSWTVSYAHFDAVDPNNLATPDDDYIEIGSGMGDVFSDALGSFPAGTLADGIYLLRVVAQPQGGGDAVFLGQVVGVGVDPASLGAQIAITSPEPSATAELVQEVRASITSERPIETWTVEYAAREDVDFSNVGAAGAGWKEIGSGSGGQDDAVVATLDTSMLKNGSYVLRISAMNDLNLGRADLVEFDVMSNAKLGRNRLEFTDVTLELAGLPIEVVRVYDSFDKDTVGDFGAGWSLKLADADILETVADTGATIFGATSFTDGTRVYLTAPDGSRVAFTFRAEVAAAGFLGTLYRAAFEPDPGNPFTLEVPEGDAGFLSLQPNGEVKLNFIGLPWNPEVYILEIPGGDRYTYDQRRGLLGIEDPNGNTVTLTPEGITHSSGQEITFTRDSLDRITAVTAPGGRIYEYNYDAAGDLVSTSDPGGDTSTYSYDSEIAHFLIGVTDPSGRMPVRFEYDEDGRLAAVIDANGNREEQSWDPAARTGTITDRRGNVTSLIYDDRGNVTATTDPLGNTTTFTYDDPDFPDTETAIETPNTRRTMRLDDRGNITSTSYMDGFLTLVTLRNSYDDEGRPLSLGYLRGRNERFEYDEMGNVTGKATGIVGGFGETLTYTAEGQVETITKNGEILRFTYDAESGKPLREEGQGGFFRTFAYGADGEINKISDSVGGAITFTPDESAGTTTITDARGGEQVATVDSATGDLILEDQNGAVTRITVSPLGREADRTLPDGNLVDREFDPEENLTSIAVPGGHTNTYTYDALNRLASETDAAGNTATVSYNPEGFVSERIDRNGKRITYEYTKFGRVATERWHAGDGSVVREFTFEYNRSKLFAATDGDSSWAFSSAFEEERPISVTYNYAGQGEFAVGYTWPNYRDDVPTKIRLFTPKDIFPDAELRANFAGDRVYGLQVDVADLEDGSARFAYDAMGRMTSIDRFDFFNTSEAFPVPLSSTKMTRDIAGDIASIRHETSTGDLAFPASEFIYTRDLEGRITTRVTPTDSAAYTYDMMGQLTSVEHTGYPDQSFSYDVSGNPSGGTYGDDNRMLTFGDFAFTYDAEGNVASRTDTATGEVRTYRYDHRNQLIAVDLQAGLGSEAETVAEYRYDFAGRMMFRIENGTKTWIVYDRDTPIFEFADGAEVFNKLYLYDLANPLLQLGEWTEADGIRWYLSDQIGSVHGLVKANGTTSDWLEYDSFGTPRSPVPSGFTGNLYAGRYWNESAALYENRLRHYDPTTARFQQQDPVRYESGDFNLYRYAENNPVSKTDPLGTTALTEYTLLYKKVSSCVKKIKPVGECIEGMFNAAAEAVKGNSAAVDVNCVRDSTSGLFGGCQ